ncbi:hypothetical protein FACS1894137_13300 [Spirochaetia bacterium]|nr:hypothetical protein FACS1894137_13300 [Spirochaetia bacterium]
MVVNEQTSQNLFKINARHLSDGLLRIIAYVAISLETQNVYLTTSNGSFRVTSQGRKLITNQKFEVRNGMILFDEIEDGINPYLTEKVINLLRGIVNNLGRQVIITTHSPVIVNDINSDEVVLLWKDKNGAVHSKPLFAIEETKEMLEFLNPGDAWMNIRQEDLLSKMNASEEAKQ